jgi:hypothetical protein
LLLLLLLVLALLLLVLLLLVVQGLGAAGVLLRAVWCHKP